MNSPTDDTATTWMADGNCRNYPPAVFFPSDGVGVDRARTHLRLLPGHRRLPRVRARTAHRSRCVGRLQRARTAPHPEASPHRRHA